MNFFSNLAKEATTLSALMEDRDKIKMDDIIKEYPEGVTIHEFELIEIDGNKVPVVTFAEDDTKFFFGGSQMKTTVDRWVNGYAADKNGGVIDPKKASDALKESGGVKCKFVKKLTKSGHTITELKVVS